MTSNILKSKSVKLGGVHRIGKDVSKTPVVENINAQAQAKIVSQNSGITIVEVTCPCGEIIQLRCVYPSNTIQAPM